MNDPAFLSLREAAEMLGAGVSYDLVHDMVHRGDLPSMRAGTRLLIPRAAIDQIVERCMNGWSPDRVIQRLAPAAGSSSVARVPSGEAIGVARDEGSTGVAAPELHVVPMRT